METGTLDYFLHHKLAGPAYLASKKNLKKEENIKDQMKQISEWMKTNENERNEQNKWKT